MKLHTAGQVACLLLVCTIILQVYSFPLEDSTCQQTAADDRNETDSASDSSHVSANVNKRSADGDSPSGNEGTEDNTDDTTTDTDEEQDDTSIEDTADDETDTRRRRDADEEGDEGRDDEDKNEDEYGGLTREAAVVSPIRRRRSHDTEDHTDVSTTEPAHDDDTSSDTTEDTESTESSTETLYRREAEASTVGTLDGSPVIVLAPSGIPVKKIPQELDQTVQKLEQRIDDFEEAVLGQSTAPTVGVLAGDSMKKDVSVKQTVSSVQYTAH